VSFAQITCQSNRRLLTGFIFQQDGTLAHTARSARNGLRANCPNFTTKEQWPPNLPNINPVDYRVYGAMSETYRKLKTKPKTIAEVKEGFKLSGAT